MEPRTRGRTFPVPVGRRLVLEVMRAARRVPLVSIRRGVNIPDVVAARADCWPAPSWVCIFAKAYGLAARRIPNLRWSWVSFPWGRIYEHPVSECSLLVEREWEGDRVLFGAKVYAPEALPLMVFHRLVTHFRDAPVWEVGDFRRLIRAARLPGLVRRFLFWSSFHRSGYVRCRRVGTFGVSSLGQFGAELVHPVVPLTAYLTYGPVSRGGQVTLGLTFDHRVMDGRHAARALDLMEQILNGEIAGELKALVKSRCEPVAV